MRKNEADATKRIAGPLPYYGLDGLPVTGLNFTTAGGKVKIWNVDTLAFGATGADAVEVGASGMYYVQLTQAEANHDSFVIVELIDPSGSGYATQYIIVAIDNTPDVNVVSWLGTAVAALTASGFIQSTLRRWLTDDAAGTPAALSATTKLVQVLLSRWATDDAAGTVITPAVNGVPKVDVADWASSAVAAPAVAGVPIVDTKYESGTVQPAPTVAGIPKVEDATVRTTVTDIQTDVDEIQVSLTTAQTAITDIQTDVDELQTAVAGVQTDTDDIQTRLPAALVGGKMDSVVSDPVTVTGDVTVGSFDISNADWARLRGTLTYGDALLDYTANTVTFPTAFSANESLIGAIITIRHNALISDPPYLGVSDPSSPITRTIIAYDGSTGIYTLDRTMVLGDTPAHYSYEVWPGGGDVISTKLSAELAVVQADTDDIQTRIPAALVGGRIDSSIGDAQDQPSRKLFGFVYDGDISGLLVLAAGSAVNDFYNGCLLHIYELNSGAAKYWTDLIVDYDGATKIPTLAKGALAGIIPENTYHCVVVRFSGYTNYGRILEHNSVTAADYTDDDMIRLGASILAGPVGDFRTNTLTFKSLDGVKTRATVTTDASGRTAVVIGDLTP